MAPTSATIHLGSYASDSPVDDGILVQAPSKEYLSSCLASSRHQGVTPHSIHIYLRASELSGHYNSLVLASLMLLLALNGTLMVHVVSGHAHGTYACTRPVLCMVRASL